MVMFQAKSIHYTAKECSGIAADGYTQMLYQQRKFLQYAANYFSHLLLLLSESRWTDVIVLCTVKYFVGFYLYFISKLTLV